MPVSQDKAFEQQCLLARKSIALSEIDPSITLDHLIEALKKGFSEVLELPLTEEDWSAAETAEIAELMASGDFIERWCGEKPVAVR